MEFVIVLGTLAVLVGLWKNELLNSTKINVTLKNSDKIKHSKKEAKKQINPVRDYSQSKENESVVAISDKNKIIEKNEQNKLTQEEMAQVSNLSDQVQTLKTEQKKVKSEEKPHQKLKKGKKLLDKFKRLDQEINQKSKQ